MIYLDMDGVLADFYRGVREIGHTEPLNQNEKHSREQNDRMWEELRKVDHFYDRLELLPGAKEMFDLIYGKYGEQCEILTGIPRPVGGLATAGEDKINWTKRKLSESVKVNIVFRKEKMRYCTGPDSVLIDDRETTIREWKEAGGTGILHVSVEKTLEEMKELGLLA